MDPIEQARARFMEALEHHNAQRLGDAERLYREALAFAPDRVSILANLAVVLASQGRLGEARPLADRALAIEPDHGDAQVVLAACLREARRPAEALAVLQAVAAGRPGDARAQGNVALVMADLGRLDDAAELHRQAVALDPGHEGAAVQLALVEARRGHGKEAFDALGPGLQASPPEAGARAAFVELVADHRYLAPEDTQFVAHLVAALTTPWCQPQRLASAAVATLRGDPAVDRLVVAAAAAWPARLPMAAATRAPLDTPLLLALLESAPVADPALERLLASLRHALLAEATREAAAHGTAVANTLRADNDDLALRCALARQCHLNDYVFPLAPAELGDATMLRRSCEQALDAGRPLPPAWLAAVACYLPLDRLDRPLRLRDRLWRTPVEALLREQVVAAGDERDATTLIERVTAIEDPVSRRIAERHDRQPFPRWTQTAVAGDATDLDAYLRRFAGGAYRRPPARSPMTALYAGCGTGQGAIDTALRFADMRVLALDLSPTQLAYAARKARDAGLPQLRCAQGDVLALMPSRDRFDLVVADGVLTAMTDPAMGLSRLVAVLADGGVLGLALCSEIGRAPLRAARAHVARRGYADSAEGVRAAREDLLSLPAVDWAAAVCAMPAFHATASCRELLFPVHDNPMSPSRAGALLADAGLAFIGIDADLRQRRRFREHFGDAGDPFALDAWDALERVHPDLFVDGYRLWAQRSRVRA